MAESMIPKNALSSMFQKSIRQRFVVIIVGHDDIKIERTKKLLAACFLSENRPFYVCDDVETCYQYVLQFPMNAVINLYVYVQDQLANDLIDDIDDCPHVKQIFILSENLPTEEERKAIQRYPKVSYFADQVNVEPTLNYDQISDVDVTQQARFKEPVSINYLDDTKSIEDTLEYEEPAERSCKTYDLNFIFRYMTFASLVDAPPFSTDKDDLMELLENNAIALPNQVKQFRETYSAKDAILFYTRDAFIYYTLNSALRTTNIHRLIPFRFIIQDICDQLRKLMLKQDDWQIFTVYRGQKANPFEVVHLLFAYHQHAPIGISSFLSTSKKRSVAMSFLTAAPDKNDQKTSSLILFQIRAEKEHASKYLPFADISKVSNHRGEEEVLFTPGQMFEINNFDVLLEHGIVIYLIEMSTFKKFTESSIEAYDIMEKGWRANMNDPILFLAGQLVLYKRVDEAKELYVHLLSKYSDDPKKKSLCLNRLLQIAFETDDTKEIEIIKKQILDNKFGSDLLPESMDPVQTRESSAQTITTISDQIQNMSSKIGSDRSLDEILVASDTDECQDFLAQTPSMVYQLSTILMQGGMYSMAILYFQEALNLLELPTITSNDTLCKAKCHMQMGHCYREMKLSNEALENYQLTLEQNVHLPLDEYIGTLIGIAKVSETMMNYKKALDKYIEVAEIYHNNLTNPEDLRNIEESIDRMTSHLIPKD